MKLIVKIDQPETLELRQWLIESRYTVDEVAMMDVKHYPNLVRELQLSQLPALYFKDDLVFYGVEVIKTIIGEYVRK